MLSELPHFNFSGRMSAYGFGSFAKGCNNYDALFLSFKVSISSLFTFLTCSAFKLFLISGIKKKKQAIKKATLPMSVKVSRFLKLDAMKKTELNINSIQPMS